MDIGPSIGYIERRKKYDNDSRCNRWKPRLPIAIGAETWDEFAGCHDLADRTNTSPPLTLRKTVRLSGYSGSDTSGRPVNYQRRISIEALHRRSQDE